MSDAHYLVCLWTDLADIRLTFDHTIGQVSTEVSAKLVNTQLRKGVSDATSEGVNNGNLNFKDKV